MTKPLYYAEGNTVRKRGTHGERADATDEALTARIADALNGSEALVAALRNAERIISHEFSSVLSGPCPNDHNICVEVTCRESGCIVRHAETASALLAAHKGEERIDGQLF